MTKESDAVQPYPPNNDHNGVNDFSRHESVFTYRYASADMREIWSENHKWKLATRLWTAVARAQQTAGLVTSEEVADLEAHIGRIDFVRLQEIEKDTKHDVVAGIRAYAEVSEIGGRILHLGMTSEDMTSNVDALRTLESIELIETELIGTLFAFGDRIDSTADIACMGWTHLQPAEPTTVGYRLARYGQNFLDDAKMLRFVKETIRAKGIKGAVGTSASFTELLRGKGISVEEFEEMVMKELGLTPALVTGQVSPRKHDAWVANALAGIGGSAVEFGLNFRLLQSPPYGELAEPRSSKQVGSSAMPWKRNPINSENAASMGGGILGDLVNTHNVAARQMLERGIDDSADRRITNPDMFFRAEEALRKVRRVVSGMTISTVAIERNLRQYGTFSGIEPLMISLVHAGADRQIVHEHFRDLSNAAFAAVEAGETNPLVKMICADEFVRSYGLTEAEITEMFENIVTHVGDAPERSRKLVEEIKAFYSDGS